MNPKGRAVWKNKTLEDRVCRMFQTKEERTTHTHRRPGLDPEWDRGKAGTVIKVLPCPRRGGAHRTVGVKGRGGSETMPGSHRVTHSMR